MRILRAAVRPYLDVLRLVWPLALGMLNNAAMQFTDRVFLARESMASLEAVLPASALVGVSLCFLQAVVAYSGTFAAQFHGAGDDASARASHRAGLLLALVAGAIMAATIPAGRHVLGLLAVGEGVVARGRIYYDICAAGSVFLFLQMATGAYLTGLGRTRVVFWANLAGNALNVALDPLLIFGWCGLPRLGIAGAAVATVAATALQEAVLAAAVWREAVRPVRGGARLAPLCGRILRFGIPSGAYAFLNLLSFTVFIFVTGGVGEVELAVSNACFTVNYLLYAPMEGFALGASTLVAQAQGRGDGDAAARAARRTLALGVGFAAVLSLSVLALYRPVLGIFAPDDPATAGRFLAIGLPLVALMAAWQVFDAADTILSGALRGAGDTKFVMWLMVLSAFGVWMPLVFLVRRCHNTMPALWATLVVNVAVLFVGTLLRWRRGGWRRIDLVFDLGFARKGKENQR